MCPPIAFFKYVLGNEWGKSARDRDLKNYIYVVLYEKRGRRPNNLRSATISATGVTARDEFQRHFHGVHLSLAPGSNLIVIKAVVIQKDSFPIPYLHGLHWTTMYDVPKCLEVVSKNGFSVSDSQAWKPTGNKSSDVSSRRTSTRKWKEAEGQGRHDMEIVELPVTNMADVMSVENSFLVMFASSAWVTTIRSIFFEIQSAWGPETFTTWCQLAARHLVVCLSSHVWFRLPLRHTIGGPTPYVQL